MGVGGEGVGGGGGRLSGSCWTASAPSWLLCNHLGFRVSRVSDPWVSMVSRVSRISRMFGGRGESLILERKCFRRELILLAKTDAGACVRFLGGSKV